MVLKASVIFLVLYQILLTSAVPKPTDYYGDSDGEDYQFSYDGEYYDDTDGEFGSENLCQLPKELGGYGRGVPLVDCDTINKMDEPPCNIYSWGGNHPKVCCPIADYLDQPAEEEEAQYDDYVEFECDPSQEGGDQGMCKTGECTPISKCAKSEFEKDVPPTACGYTNEGEDMVCCSDNKGPKVLYSQEPQFKIPVVGNRFTNERAYPCSDHSWKCLDWATNHPESCKPGHKSYMFMRNACPQTCGRCINIQRKGNVGCIDNFAKCQEWSRNGRCALDPFFMSFNCRESCGTCGFKSAHFANKIQQTKNEKEQYTNIKGFNNKKFKCGNFKKISKDKINKVVKNETKIIGVGCSSVVISDRFVITAAHCVPAELGQGETRQIGIRDGTEYAETVSVRRVWKDTRFDPNSKEIYYDIAVLELERRVIYDYEKYGDSPACLGKILDLSGRKGLVQGFGINEDGVVPGGVTEVDVNIISNEDCQREMNELTKKYGKEKDLALPDGLTPAILCTKGRWNKKKSVFTGPCDGDDGGPLYVNQKINKETGDIEERTLVAINSGSLGKCGRENFPAWWTRVASYIDWLECIQVEAATLVINEEIQEEVDQTHSQIEDKCKSKLPPLPKKPF